ncbi:MAG: glutamine-hydrolyzing GMP synthase [Magnetococcales bacterium]|nr:glutamine-hydrolyzing GMP synthase [Magnetococcales bacterium]
MSQTVAERIHSEKILILDFGSQYTQLIARRIRECQVYCEIHPWNMNPAEIRAFAPQGVILSGGHRSVYEEGAPTLAEEILELNVPVLGICYGMQLLAQQFGGTVIAAERKEYGHAEIQRTETRHPMFDALFQGGVADVWMSHGDHVEQAPEGFSVVAASDNAPVAGIINEEKALFAVQFHPEVGHTPRGKYLIETFVRKVCKCHGFWTTESFVDYAITEIKRAVGDEKVLLGLSGGVDSSVVAALLHRAIGDRLTCVFVDNGLLRLNEGDQVMATFAEHMGVNVIRVDAEERFLSGLAGVSDPEKKRKIIGHTFIDVFEEESKKIDGVAWLAQGTIYPDVIESAGAKSGVVEFYHWEEAKKSTSTNMNMSADHRFLFLN